MPAAPSPTTSAPPSDPAAAGVRARILVAARREFAARGRDATSVRRIAGRAGVTAAMINYYFRGKGALYEEVVAEAMGRLLGRVKLALVETPGGPGLPVRLTQAYFDYLAEDRDLQRLVMREVLDRGESSASYARRYLAPLRALLVRRFGGGAEASQLAISLFGAVAAYFLYEPVLADFLGDDPLSAERLAARRRHVVALATRLAPAGPEPQNPTDASERRPDEDDS